MLIEILCLLLVIYLISNYFGRSKSREKFPAGPWGFPILGHMPLLGMSPHKKFMEWSIKFGPIFTVRFGSFQTIVLNDPKIIREAFSLPSFAGREKIEPFYGGSEGKGFAFLEGPESSEQRQFIMKNLRDFGYGRKNIEGKIQDEICELVNYIKKIIESGEHQIQVRGLFSAFVVNALWSIVVGERFSYEDPDIRHLSQLVSDKILRSDTFMGQLAMFIPWIANWMPHLTGFKEKIEAFKELHSYVKNRIDIRKQSWIPGQPRDLTDAYLDKVVDTTEFNSTFHPERKFQEKSTGELFMGGVDTIATSLEWMINYLARNPSVQEKLYNEIIQIVGPTRIPSLSDRPSMPYTECVIIELLRISSIAPLGFFHRTMTKVHFRTYDIPKHTMIVANLYGVHHSQQIWGDPETFRPDRFLGSDRRIMKNDDVIAFGWGKRGCLGEGLAREQLFLYTTSLCQQFRLEMPKGAPELKTFFGVQLHPHPFQVKFFERE